MIYRIADTFTESLNKLTGDEQKAVKTTAFDLQMDPSRPGLSFHKLDKAQDKNFWSVRVTRDIRLIVHRTESSLLLCYVAHHDDAYKWAERRKLETHPRTGAAQFVVIEKTTRTIEVPVYVQTEQPEPVKPALFADVSNEVLLACGVPELWIEVVKTVTEDSLFDLTENLPGEAMEALLEMATGDRPKDVIKAKVQFFQPTGKLDPFEHPDAKRRFRVMTNREELERALEYPWEKWTVFLHPAQREFVERSYNGAARIAGSAGTGKTVVALHRAAFLARQNPDARVLLTTFSDMLANALRAQLKRLVGNEPLVYERIEVHGFESMALRLYRGLWGEPNLADPAELRGMMREALTGTEEQRFSDAFVWAEWRDIIDEWQLASWEDYRKVPRVGRKSRLSEKQREAIWGAVEKFRVALDERGLLTPAMVFGKLTEHYRETVQRPYDFIVVDEAQDIGVPQLRLIAEMGSEGTDGLFFAGDLGQRIFQPPFSWKALGVDVRGRSRTLKINYRTSHQIRSRADQLLAPEISDVDGNTEERRGTISVFDGPEPVIKVYDSTEEESEGVAGWLKRLRDEGFQPHEIGVFVRSASQFERTQSAANEAGVDVILLDEQFQTRSGKMPVCTMHLAKGLEFRAVCVMACDDEIIPLQERLEQAGDDSDLEEIYNTERHLLYVACTRARDRLMLSGVVPASEFLDDLKMG